MVIKSIKNYKLKIKNCGLFLIFIFHFSFFILNCLYGYPFKTGCLPSPYEKVKNLVRYAAPSPSLPSKVDLSNSCPPVGDQGAQGSCVAWSIGYYYKSFQEAKERGWSLTTQTHQFSPAFIYNQINGGVDAGSNPYDAMKLLIDKGCATLDTTPYDDTDYEIWPTTNAYLSALPYRAKEMSFFFINAGTIDDIVIDAMKSHLAAGDIFEMSIPVYENFQDTNTLKATNYIHDTPSGALLGYHAIAIVGYDDNISSNTTGTVKGGFKLRNSWDTWWGDGGSAYLSYNFVKNYATEAVYMTDKTAYSPTATAEIRIDHPIRKELVLTLVGGGWSQTVYENAGGFVENIHTIVDVSEGPPPASAGWSLIVEDNVNFTTYTVTSSTISIFNITCNSVNYLSADVPKNIPNLGKVIAHIGTPSVFIEKPKNFPNPFYPKNQSKVTVRIHEDYCGANLRVTIYNIAGLPVRTLDEVSNETSPEIGLAYWDGRNDNGDMVASGLYYYVIDTGGKKFRGKITLIK
ncbi:MAG: hypothetical protein HY919_01890 [Elusimicrobia bacterium]|nr:hypothetical protein [Elusimicrobiota bacterium]